MGGEAINPTRARPVRISDERWKTFAAQVGDRGRAEAINDFIAWMNHEPGAKMPKRPPAPASAGG
jgi:hypothetical protein